MALRQLFRPFFGTVTMPLPPRVGTVVSGKAEIRAMFAVTSITYYRHRVSIVAIKTYQRLRLTDPRDQDQAASFRCRAPVLHTRKVRRGPFSDHLVP